MAAGDKRCIDCVAESLVNKRPAPHPGPRCASHWRAKKAERKQTARARRWETIYSISAEKYDALYQSQGGRCYICRIGQGLSKALYVDHDHACCDGPTSCGKCVRGLIDDPCNTYLGRIRDSVEAVERMAEYLRNPPARKILDNWNE